MNPDINEWNDVITLVYIDFAVSGQLANSYQRVDHLLCSLH